MEGLTRLVNDSLADHGYEPKLDHRRLQWSKWFRCESSFSVLLAPCQPGIFALGEEIVAGGAGSKRMLPFSISRKLATSAWRWAACFSLEAYSVNASRVDAVLPAMP